MPRLHLLSPLSALLLSLGLVAGCDDVPDLSLPNEPPVAVDDEGAILQDAATDVFVTNNDTDIDGDPLTVELTSAPTNGTVTVVDDSYFRYVPNRLFVGTDTFGYRVTDTAGFQDEAVVTINVKQRELRAVFSTEIPAPVRGSGGEQLQRVYMVDSRTPGELVDLSSALAADESVRAWVYDDAQQRAVMLTDADRVLAVPLDDPAAAESFELTLTDTETVDPGIDISGEQIIAYSVNNRFIRTLNLLSGVGQSFDTGWTNSTMQMRFYSASGATVVTSGTLGDPAATAIYSNTLANVAPLLIVDGQDPDAAPRIRFFPQQNVILWALEQPGPVETGGFTCADPPAQRLSNISHTSLANPTTSTDLNAGSGLFADPAVVLSYSLATRTASVLISGCGAGDDTVSIVQVPYADPSQSRVIATTTESADALHRVDFADGGDWVVYSVEDGAGLRAFLLQLEATTVDSTELTGDLPSYQGIATDTGLRAPLSAFSSDGLRWLYVVPDDSGSQLGMLDVGTLEVTEFGLPFDGNTPVSDGYHAFTTTVNSSGDTEIATLNLDEGTVATVIAPGSITTDDAALARPTTVRLAPVPVSQD